MVAPEPTSPSAAVSPGGPVASSTGPMAPASRRHGLRPRWRRRAPVEEPGPEPRLYSEDGLPVFIVPNGDFVACSYAGCGALRPIDEVAAKTPCTGCGRV